MRISDWSSDVCSSDLSGNDRRTRLAEHEVRTVAARYAVAYGRVATESQGGVGAADRIVNGGRTVEGQRRTRAADIAAAGVRTVADSRLAVECHRSEKRRSGKQGGRTCRSRW